MEVLIKVPENVNASMTDSTLVIKGPEGEVKRSFPMIEARLSVKGDEIRISSTGASRKFKRVINSIAAHVKNMINGVQKNYVYKLTICYQHFPINVKVQGEKVVIENFYGEKKPRIARVMPGVSVKVDGSKITVKGPDKEGAGQTAANLELATRIVKRDKRVFQDGIWITSKSGDAE